MILTFLWLAGIVCTIGGFAVQPRDQAPAFFLIGITMLLLASKISFKKHKEAQLKESASQNMSYDEKKQMLTVYSCSPTNERILKISAMLDVGYKYHDAELVYTGATVGGVHVGGTHVNDAYLSGQIRGKTGKYQLVYTGNVSKEGFYPIKEIVLTKELIEKAKKLPSIAKFLNGDRLRLRHDVKSTVPEYMRQAQMEYYNKGRLDVATEIGKQDYIKSQLTKEECQAVVSFLTTK